MASNISNRISLDGGDDVRKQIVAIADEAERLFKGISSLAAQFGRIDTSGLNQTQDQLRQTAQTATAAGEQVRGAGEGVLSFAVKAAAGVTALVIAGNAVLQSLGSAAASSAGALSDTAQKLGLSVDAYQRLQKAADDAGLSVEGLNQILGNIDRAATNAAGSVERIVPVDTIGRFQQVGGSLQQIAGGLAVAQQQADAFGRSAGGSIALIQKFGESTVRIINGVSKSTFDLASSADRLKQGAAAAADALAKLGLSSAVLSKLSPEERLRAMADQLDKLPESAAKSALAAQLFGQEWRKALDFIRALPVALNPATESIRELGDGEVKAGTTLRDSLKDLGSAFDALKNRIDNLLAPGQTARADWLTKLIDDVNRLLKQFVTAEDAKQKLLGAGHDFLDQLGRLQEFLNQSGRTGLADALGVIRELSVSVATLWTNVLVPAGTLLMAAFNGIAAVINATFGTKISGYFIALVVAVGLLTGAFGLLSAVLSPIGAVIVALGLGFAALSQDTAAMDSLRGIFAGVGTEIIRLTGVVRAFLAGIWKDLIAAFQGRDADVKNGFILALRDTLLSIPEIIRIVVGAFAGLFAAIQAITPLFNSLFGTNLSAGGLALLIVLVQLAGGFALLNGALVGIAAVSTVVVNGFSSLAAVLGVLGLTAGEVFIPLLAVLAVLAVKTDTGRAALRALGVDIDAVDGVIRAVTTTIDEFLARLIGIRPFQVFADGWKLIGNLPDVWAGLVEQFDNAVAAITSAGRNLVTSIGGILTQGIPSAWQGVVDQFNQAVSAITSAANTLMSSLSSIITEGIPNAWQWLVDQLDGVVEAIKSKIGDALSALRNLLPGSVGGGTEGAGTFAAGGWTGSGGRLEPAGIVHREEYVEPAHVVRQPGVLAFLEMLRRTGGDLHKVISMFVGGQGFASGGAVGFARNFSFDLPGYADGGLVAGLSGGGLHPVILQLPGGDKVQGLSVKASALEQVERELRIKAMFRSR